MWALAISRQCLLLPLGVNVVLMCTINFLSPCPLPLVCHPFLGLGPPCNSRSMMEMQMVVMMMMMLLLMLMMSVVMRMVMMIMMNMMSRLMMMMMMRMLMMLMMVMVIIVLMIRSQGPSPRG